MRVGEIGVRVVCTIAMCAAAICSAGCAATRSASPETKAAANLATRVLGGRAGEFRFVLIPAENGPDVFECEASRGVATIRGSSGVAMASGLNWYLKYACNAHVSWCGSQLDLPRPLPDAPKTRISTPYRYRYFFNYCTFSYTMAFWDWSQWEKHIDWMALNGINAPLAVTGQEAIWQNLYRAMGMKEQDVARFFVGPAYLPFGWMGCIDGWAGPLPQSWIDSHVDLQKKILARQRELGMTPVLQGFTGHISPAIKALRPEIKLRQLPSWCGFAGTYMVDPSDPAFVQIGKAFVGEQARLFGTDRLYASDTFIEMSPPSNDPAFLDKMGKSIYQGMASADPQAIWLMQGWVFVNNPNFWKPPQAKAILQSVGNRKLVLLDLFCDSQPAWKLTESFHGQPWVWCVLHSFGGVSGTYGNLATVAEDPPAALRDPKRGDLCGIGMMMEAFGHNPIYYDLMAEMTWRRESPDLDKWVADYARRRYGAAPPQAQEAWEILQRTVYSGGLVDSLICSRPALTHTAPKPPYDPLKIVDAWRLLLECADQLAASDGFRYDLTDVGRQVLANLSGPLYGRMLDAARRKDRAQLAAASQRFLELIRDMDQLVGTRREFLLGRWIADAKRWAGNDRERALYEWNARNQITLWGDRDSSLHDYARKQWSGLLSDFYLARWEMFLKRLGASLESGTPFDAALFEKDVRQLEDHWTHRRDEFPAEPQGDSIAVGRKMLEKYRPLIREIYAARP